MLFCYAVLTLIHIVAIIVTGVMWMVIDVNHQTSLRTQLRDIRAVHFGSLYLVPWFLGLAYAFDRLHVPAPHWMIFPAGLGALVFFSGIGYLFPRPPGLDPFYYWTRGIPLVLALIGLVLLAVAMVWTGVVLCVYAWG
jgi:hypothetical protein